MNFDISKNVNNTFSNYNMKMPSMKNMAVMALFVAGIALYGSKIVKLIKSLKETVSVSFKLKKAKLKERILEKRAEEYRKKILGLDDEIIRLSSNIGLYAQEAEKTEEEISELKSEKEIMDSRHFEELENIRSETEGLGYDAIHLLYKEFIDKSENAGKIATENIYEKGQLLAENKNLLEESKKSLDKYKEIHSSLQNRLEEINIEVHALRDSIRELLEKRDGV